MSGTPTNKKGFGHGSWGGAGKLPWGGFVPDPVINESLKIAGYKAVLNKNSPAVPVGFKGVAELLNESLSVMGYKAVLDLEKPSSPKGFRGVKL